MGRVANAGRKRKSDAQKKLEGRDRADRRSKARAPDGKLEVLDLQQGISTRQLSSEAQKILDRLCSYAKELGYDDSTQADVYVLLAIRLEEVYELYDFLQQRGRTYEKDTQWGTELRTRPEVKQLNDAMKQSQSLLSELGLTPSSAARIGTPGGEEGHNPWAEDED